MQVNNRIFGALREFLYVTIHLTQMYLFSVFVALISVLSAVGICDRCRIESGGVYFLISHTLGSRLGGALGMVYCFGQVNKNTY